jgi:hypothetical protein
MNLDREKGGGPPSWRHIAGRDVIDQKFSGALQGATFEEVDARSIGAVERLILKLLCVAQSREDIAYFTGK